MQQFPLDKTFIIATWLEALVFGFFFCLFAASVYVNATLRSHDVHSRTMFYIGCAMFVLSIIHLAMNCFRMIQGYVIHVNEPGGAVAYIGDLRPWHHIFKDTIYATMEIFGDGVAIYRTWIIWNRNWKIIVLPFILFIASCVSGYTVCGLYITVDPTASVFSPVLTQWIKTFYSIAVVQSTLTTGLMAYRIWATDRRTAHYRTAASTLLPVLKILLESASLLLVTEILLLSLYLANYNAQYILLEIVTPLVGITFTAITIRIQLRMSGMLSSTSQQQLSGQRPAANDLASHGAIPMRGIAINITKDVERDANDMNSDKDMSSDKINYDADFQQPPARRDL
ncbi:hypothetical protein EIP91_003350 [Steccherinum ochraceum]|uniref:Uncharacterized protein n=1 Tax=Steccherinum ochraceum TaxID=92696 RepID=A0A4R0RRC0_9APHY|nr:hypothetical protein EIP91_003350 [Steccherinum ochraceum]